MELKKNLDEFDPYDSKAIDSLKIIKQELNNYEKYISELNYKLSQIEIQYFSLNELSCKFNVVQEKSMIIEDIIDELNLDDSLKKEFDDLRKTLNDELSKININKNSNLEYERFKIKKELKEMQCNRNNTLNTYNSLMIQYSKDSNYADKIKNLYKLEAKIEESFDTYKSFLNNMKASLNNYEEKTKKLEKEIKSEKEDLDKKRKYLKIAFLHI